MNRTAAQALADLAHVRVKLLEGVELPERGSRSAAMVAGLAAPASPREPVYGAEAARDVQGNIVPGFNKNHQQFLFLRFGAVAAARGWLRWLAPRLTTMEEAAGFRAEFRVQRLRLGVREPEMTATWTSAALSYGGIRALVGEDEAVTFGEQSFRQGLHERSTYLGDPSDPARLGHRDNWVVGGPGNEADALVIVAADEPGDLESAVDQVLAAAADHDLSLLFTQRCATLPDDLQGHEHFGFKDGISQPGVRGSLSTGADLTRRYLADDDPRSALFAKPGQPLVWPGQFLLGEPRQDPRDPLNAAPAAAKFPDWASRGSYLVCRRLKQDVVAFWEFAASLGERMGLPAVDVASRLVGRWPSGAPIMRSPDRDDAGLAGDEFANNHFLFDDDTRPSVLTPIPGYGGDTYAQALGDVFGAVCPHAAHIRKVNPRDSATDFGTPADTLLRLMLRRGIPYGPPVAGVPDPPPELLDADRGLMFVAYMSSVEDQFEFITRRWANSTVQPNLGGHDPVIGQRDKAGSRMRTLQLPSADGNPISVELPDEWVVPTGGGYFFAPPISAFTGALAA